MLLLLLLLLLLLFYIQCTDALLFMLNKQRIQIYVSSIWLFYIQKACATWNVAKINPIPYWNPMCKDSWMSKNRYHFSSSLPPPSPIYVLRWHLKGNFNILTHWITRLMCSGDIWRVTIAFSYHNILILCPQVTFEG